MWSPTRHFVKSPSTLRAYRWGLFVVISPYVFSPLPLFSGTTQSRRRTNTEQETRDNKKKQNQFTTNQEDQQCQCLWRRRHRGSGVGGGVRQTPLNENRRQSILHDHTTLSDASFRGESWRTPRSAIATVDSAHEGPRALATGPGRQLQKSKQRQPYIHLTLVSATLVREGRATMLAFVPRRSAVEAM